MFDACEDKIFEQNLKITKLQFTQLNIQKFTDNLDSKLFNIDEKSKFQKEALYLKKKINKLENKNLIKNKKIKIQLA
jgi:hypothetical protein